LSPRFLLLYGVEKGRGKGRPGGVLAAIAGRSADDAEFGAAIGGAIAGGGGHVFAEADGLDEGGADALTDEGGADCEGATFSQLAIVFFGADGIGKAGDDDGIVSPLALEVLGDGGDFGEFGAVDFKAIEREVDGGKEAFLDGVAAGAEKGDAFIAAGQGDGTWIAASVPVAAVLATGAGAGREEENAQGSQTETGIFSEGAGFGVRVCIFHVGKKAERINESNWARKCGPCR
jgi:hypothetical protein